MFTFWLGWHEAAQALVRQEAERRGHLEKVRHQCSARI
jgi:hypothetical protein